MTDTPHKQGQAYFDKEYRISETIRRLIEFGNEQKSHLILLFFLILLNSVVAIIVPLLIRDGINSLNPAQGSVDYNFAINMGWLYLIGAIIEWIVLYFQIKVTWIVAARSISSVRLKLFKKLQEVDIGFYDKMATGRIMSRVMDDTNKMGNLINTIAFFFSSIAIVIIMVSILFSINVKITGYILMFIPGILVIMIFLAGFVRKFEREVRKTREAVNGAVQETITGVSVTKGFNRETKNRVEFMDINRNNLKASLRLSYTYSIFFPLIDILSVFTLFIIINGGGSLVINSNSLGIGDLYLFYSYTIRLFIPIIDISFQIAEIHAGSAATERIFSLLDLKTSMKSGTTSIEKLQGNISFNDVTFAYKREEPIYQNLNLSIEAGQTIALVGQTGAGKTTLVSLLARFYEIQSGEILVDDMNVQNINIEDYRDNLGIVLQDPYLFSGTIEENILYGNPDASSERLNLVIKLTHLDEFIDSLPDGIKTDVRERGSRLSTGQRQLVTFARALIADPSILILDEATASVDAYTESMIQQGLEALFEGRTSIVVAHRLSTIINADRIIVFSDGEIVGDGSHNDLLETNLTYKALYKTYYEFQSIAITT